MGTNYYLVQESPCPCCGRDYDRIHIGKKSFGWAFVFCNSLIETAQGWREKTKEQGVVDEYGDKISYEDFWKMVDESKGLMSLRDDPSYADRWEAHECFDLEGYRFMNGYFC